MAEKKTRNRLPSTIKLPTIQFEEVIRIIKDATKLGGTSASMDALASASGNSVTSSTFNHKLSALRVFGLIQNSDKVNYVMTKLAENIVQPESSEQEIISIQQAFTNQDTLNKVWEQYKGKILPQVEYLANFMDKTLGVPSASKTEWAQYFINGAKFAGLTMERGDTGNYQLLSNYGTLGMKKETVTDNTANQPPKEPKKEIAPYFKANIADIMLNSLENEEWGINYKRTLSSGKKMYIYIPEPLSESDVNSIRQILKSVDTGIDGLKGEVLNFENGPK